MARKYRKRRMRMKRRKGRRRTRYQRYRGKGAISEIKYYTGITQNQSNKLHVSAGNAATLYGEQNYITDMLRDITQGTNYTQRIGNKIYAMYINIRMSVWSCPSSADYDIGTFLLRIILHNQRVGAGGAIAGFFGVAAKQNFHLPIDRKAVTVHYDRLHQIQANESVAEYSGVYELTGAARMININIPINRYITYTIGGEVKEDYNVYSLAMLTLTSGYGDVGNNAVQVGCHSLAYRIYFKDA